MKKLLFVVTASFFSGAVYAQVQTPAIQYNNFGPKELMCTEEAISFRVNIRPGLQLYSFRPGYTDYDNGPSNFTLSKNYNGEDMIAEPVQLVKHANTFDGQAAYFNKNFLFPGKTISSPTQTSLFANEHFFYDYYNSLRAWNLNLLLLPAN